MMKGVFVHPSAIVETVLIGEGTRIWAFAHVMKDVSIGVNCNIGDHCFIESGVVVGNNVTIKNGNMIWRRRDTTVMNGCCPPSSNKAPRWALEGSCLPALALVSSPWSEPEAWSRRMCLHMLW
jgi:carbonic anhydrase/acetyltransferase-like protein (isoleucine patch superfamily)